MTAGLTLAMSATTLLAEMGEKAFHRSLAARLDEDPTRLGRESAGAKKIKIVISMPIERYEHTDNIDGPSLSFINRAR